MKTWRILTGLLLAGSLTCLATVPVTNSWAVENPNSSATTEKPDSPAVTEKTDSTETTAAASDYTSISHGHIDIFHGTSTDKNNLVLQMGDDTHSGDKETTRVFRTPESGILDVVKERWVSQKDQHNFAELTGGEAAILPMTQVDNSLWPGWDMMEAKPGFNAVDIVFDEVVAPANSKIVVASDGALGSGKFASYLKDPKSPDKENYDLKAGLYIHNEPLSHTHVYWAFTKPGIYQFKVHLRNGAKDGIDSGKYVCSRSATYTWRVFDKEGKLPTELKMENLGEPVADLGCQASSNNSMHQVRGTLKAPDAKTLLGIKATETSTEKPTTNDKPVEDKPSNNTDQPNPQPSTPAVPADCKPYPVGKASGGTSSYSGGGSYRIPFNTHVHPRWVFTAPGTYNVTIRQTVTLKSGKTVSASTPLRFNVGGSGNANEGHFDIGAEVVNDTLRAVVKDDRTSPARWVSPASLTFGLGDAAKATAPAGIEFIAPAGKTIWMIPEVQKAGVPWLGANTMTPSMVANAPQGAVWSIESFNGPGQMALFQSASFGGKAVVWLNTASGKTVTTPGTTASGPNQTVKNGVIYEWKTPDGQACTPTEAQKAALAHTGTSPLNLAIAVLAMGITVLGVGVLVNRKLLHTQQ